MEAGAAKARLLNALKWLVTLGAFAYLLSRQSLHELGAALATVSPLAVAAGLALSSVAVMLSAVRWTLTLRAYGAARLPDAVTALYYTWLGLFYNTYVPGAVGGDVVRGVAARGCFDEDGTARSLAVVLIDRLLGLSGLLSLVATTLFLVPIPGLELPAYAALLGPLAAVGTLASVYAARALSRVIPGKLGALLASMPALVQISPLLLAFALAVLNHLLVSVAVHLIVASVSDVPTVGQSFVVVPISNAAGFFPLSIAGLGLRDTALVGLYGMLGVPRAVALAGALSFVVCLFATAGVGGIWQLLRPLDGGVREAAIQSTRPPLR